MKNVLNYPRVFRLAGFLKVALILGAVVLATLLISISVARADRVVTISSVSTFVNVRDAPSMRGQVFSSFPNNEDAFLISEVPGWYKVRLWNGYEGYVSKRFTRTIRHPPGSAESYSQWPGDRR